MTIKFNSHPVRDQTPLPGGPFDRWLTPEGDETSLFYRDGRNFVVRFPDLVDFTIDVDLGSVTAVPARKLPEDVLLHLYFNQVLPLVMGYNGDMVLHASAVSLDGRALAFLGTSRRGKSTLAAAFAKAGHPFLTDDGLILDLQGGRYWVRPRAARLRLCADSAQAILGHESTSELIDGYKGSFVAGSSVPHSDQSAPLAAIFVLVEPQHRDQPEIASLSRSATVAQLLQHTFILDSEDGDRMRKLLDQLISLSGQVPCFTLDYPRDYSLMPIVLDTLIKHLKEVEP